MSECPFLLNTTTPGMIGFKEGNGINAITYPANDVDSPVLEFSNLELVIISGSTFGGLFPDCK